MSDMAGYLAQKIKDAKDAGGLTAGQAKYRAAFIKTKLYAAYKADADTILELDGYGDCIVTA